MASKRTQLGILAGLWLAGTAALFFGAYRLRYTLTNIDGISYIRIAEHWAAGRFDEAINAYWAPMISWSMLPFMAAGADSQFAFMLASASWSSLGVAAGTYFVWKHSGRNFASALVVEIVVGVLCLGNLLILTPDLLVVTWILLFAWVLAEVDERLTSGTVRQRVLAGVLLGAVCVLGYLIKQFLIPVFVVLLLGWLAVRILGLRRSAERGTASSKPADAPGFGARLKPLLVLPLAALVTLVIVAAPWVTALSIKYGSPTIGSSFAVNTATKLDPTANGDELAPSLELAAPPTEHAVSFGEDRTYQVVSRTVDPTPGTVGKPSESTTKKSNLVQGLAYYGLERLKALPWYLDKLTMMAPFAVPLIAGFLLALAFGLISARKHRVAVIAAAVFAVYFLGYLGLTSAAGKGGSLRYYWPLLPLSAVVAALLWPKVWRRAREFDGWWRRALAIVLLCLIPLAALSQHGLNIGYPFSAGEISGSLVYLRSEPQKPEAQLISERLQADGLLAEGDRIVAGSGKVHRTLLYAFYARAQLWGRDVPHDITDPAFQQVMRDDKIRYYFLYEPRENPTMDVSAFGTVVGDYDLPYECGSAGGKKSEGCRLSIVKIDY